MSRSAFSRVVSTPRCRYLERGESLTYVIGQTLTYGTGESLTPKGDVEVPSARLWKKADSEGVGGDFVFAKKAGSATDIFVTELATKTVTTLAVVAVQLNKGLGVGSIFTSDAC